MGRVCTAIVSILPGNRILILSSADMSKSVFRYIAEEAWRTEGRLGILVRVTIIHLCIRCSCYVPQMQRIEQMNIISDLLGVIDPDADLQVLVDGGEVIPGAYLLPQQVNWLKTCKRLCADSIF